MFERIFKFTRIAFLALWGNKSQALLTMLGIIIGISAVIIVLSIGRGAERVILSSVESFGSRSIFVQPGGQEGGGPPSPTAIDKLKYRDYLAIKDFDYLQDVAPVIVYSTVISYKNENQITRVVGSNEQYFRSLNGGIGLGRDLIEDDINLSKPVVVLGLTVVEELFGDEDPIGERVKINGKNFTVIGVSEKLGSRFFQDFDARVVIPITTYRTQIQGGDYVLGILAHVREGYPINEAMDDLRRVIRKRHSIYNPEDDPLKDDFRVVSQVDAAETFQSVADAMTYFLVTVAAISLLVGGIGIMNIMFVSVSERTREIGLRKAVGATNSDIMIQFLIEAIVLTFIAGFIGIVFGILVSYGVSAIVVKFLEEWEFIVTLESVLIAFFVSVLIGMFFGIYPARKAAKLNPIQALISE